MEGEGFLTEYMKDFKDDYILIGGNACALHFEELGAPFRATADLDIVLITESSNQGFYKHLTTYLHTHGYEGKRFKGSNQGGSAYRFTLAEDKRGNGQPVQIELFAKKPEYFDETKDSKLHITPIETGDGISNFSAILLDDDIYDFIRSSEMSLRGVSTVNLTCLLGLKSVAWHSNQELKNNGEDIKDDTIFKHPADMLRIISIIEPEVMQYPDAIYDSLQHSREKFGNSEIRAVIPLTNGMDFEATIQYLNEYVTRRTVS